MKTKRIKQRRRRWYNSDDTYPSVDTNTVPINMCWGRLYQFNLFIIYLFILLSLNIIQSIFHSSGFRVIYLIKFDRLASTTEVQHVSVPPGNGMMTMAMTTMMMMMMTQQWRCKLTSFTSQNFSFIVIIAN